MRHPDDSPIFRLRVTPDEPDAIVAPRPRGSRRPHTDLKVAHVRRLIEQSTLTYGEIAAKTGVGRASICRWTQDGGWKRPPFAPRATDTIPTARASAKLKMRTLAARLQALAERHIRALETSPRIDADKLGEALELLKMARLEAMGRRRPRRMIGETLTGRQWMGRQEAIRSALTEMARGGVNVERVPKEAMEMAVEARMAPEDERELRGRGRRGR
jgi:hypothetical protein